MKLEEVAGWKETRISSYWVQNGQYILQLALYMMDRVGKLDKTDQIESMDKIEKAAWLRARKCRQNHQKWSVNLPTLPTISQAVFSSINQ